jgi:membrane-associated protease RseP (regulator of RpoE activity)
MALFGEGFFRMLGIEFLLLWVACGFFSILLHELGHALFIRWFGSPSAIVLTGFGGYAENPYPPRSPWKRLLISLAGPGSQLMLVGILYGTAELTGWPGQSVYLRWTFTFLLWMNLFWAIINLLPIYPLDGGRIIREIFVILRLRNPDPLTHIVSILFAGVMVLRGLLGFLQIRLRFVDDILPEWLRPGMFMTIWLVMFIVLNYQLYQMAIRRARYYRDPFDDDDSLPWQR